MHHLQTTMPDLTSMRTRSLKEKLAENARGVGETKNHRNIPQYVSKDHTLNPSSMPPGVEKAKSDENRTIGEVIFKGTSRTRQSEADT